MIHTAPVRFADIMVFSGPKMRVRRGTHILKKLLVTILMALVRSSHIIYSYGNFRLVDKIAFLILLRFSTFYYY